MTANLLRRRRPQNRHDVCVNVSGDGVGGRNNPYPITLLEPDRVKLASGVLKE